jgi:hypothetical protein
MVDVICQKIVFVSDSVQVGGFGVELHREHCLQPLLDQLHDWLLRGNAGLGLLLECSLIAKPYVLTR